MKYFVLLLSVVYPASALSQNSIKALRDTLQLRSREFVTQPVSGSAKAYPLEKGDPPQKARSNGKDFPLEKDLSLRKENGNTRTVAFGRNFQFVAGNSADAQVQGDSAYINAYLIHKSIKVWRNGLYQYNGLADGVKFDNATGKIVFYPRLISGDKIYIETLNGF